MGEILGSYYAGVLDFERGMPNLENVAACIDLLHTSDVKFIVGKAATGEDGHVRFPFLVKDDERQPFGKAVGITMSSIEAVKEVFSGSCEVRSKKMLPRVDNIDHVRACARLASFDPGARPVRVEDLREVRDKGRAGSPEALFEGLVGMERQRKVVYEIGNAVVKRGRGALESVHMVFSGPAGTGKTELARRLLAFFDANGVTCGDGVFAHVDASELIGRYVGHTPRLVRGAVERARGGMLFIDEAYRLVDGESNQYGIEAVNALNELLEAERDRIVCIMAGYPDKMDALLSANAGLRDRFSFRVEFDGYSDSELVEIFETFARAKGYVVMPSARLEVEGAVSVLRRRKGFSHARTMRRLFDRCVIKQALRTEGMLIAAEDVRAALEDDDLSGASERPRIGFL